MKISRILFDILALVSVLYLPWWTALAFLAVGIFLFHSYYEAMVGGVLMDSFFGLNTGSFFTTYQYTLLLSATFLLSFWLKDKVFFNRGFND